VRPTAPLPERYRVSLRVGFADCGDGLPGLNGYDGGETAEPWSSTAATSQNGFYWLAILDAPPRPHNNVWIHHHRKVVVDSDNHFPAWMEIFDGSGFVWSGEHPVMMFALDGRGEAQLTSGKPFLSYSGDSWQPSGKIRAVEKNGGGVRAAGEPPVASGRSIVKRRKTEQAHICIGTTGVSRHDPDRFAFGVVNNALGGGMSSRLFQEIREQRGLAYSVYSYHSMYAEAGLFCAYAGTTPVRAQEVVDLIRRELADVAEHGLTAAEFDRAKGHMKGALVLSQEDPGGRMSRLGKSEIGHGEILTLNQMLRRIDAVSLEDARRVAERVLSQPMSLTVLGPFRKSEIA
jgi:hypothetical protein